PKARTRSSTCSCYSSGSGAPRHREVSKSVPPRLNSVFLRCLCYLLFKNQRARSRDDKAWATGANGENRARASMRSKSLREILSKMKDFFFLWYGGTKR